MAKITREPQKIFGGSLTPSNNIAVFGSLKAGSPAYSGDPSTIQSAAYLLGWADAVVANQAPALQDMNALFYNDSYQLSYLMQAGVPEWDAATIYYIGSIANDALGTLYMSITDANTNHALTDTTYWRRLIAGSAMVAENYSLVTSVAANALTIAMKDAAGNDATASSSAQFGFRSATEASGLFTLVKVSAALSLVVPSTGTLGSVSGVDTYAYLYLLNNGGAGELAISLKKFDDGSIVSTSAIAGSPTSATTMYSTTARSNVPVRLIQRIKFNEATAGTWASNVLEASQGTAFLTGGSVGSTQGVAVPAGYVGEVLSSTVAAVSAAASNTYGNVTSLALTPGKWHIHGTLITNRSGATITAGNQNAAYSLITSSTPGAGSVRGKDQYPMNGGFDPTYADMAWPIGGYAVDISANTTYYLHAQNKYTAGTPTWDAYLEAVRIA